VQNLVVVLAAVLAVVLAFAAVKYG